MKMDMKLVLFILMLAVVLVDAQVNLLREAAFLRITTFNYLFPKDPDVVRVRKPEEIQTMRSVTSLDFIGLVEKYGYPAEEHYVTTEDGYNLVIHRIPGSPLSKSRQGKKVVFLQHGLTASSDCWVLIGPGKDLVFLLADQGYDVWLGNYRGNTYCRSHIKLSPRNREFWQFSFHEMGTRDLPAMIDYVLNYTKQETLSYIGHSMGTTGLFVLLSTRSEYNAKIKLGICLAPVAILKEISAILNEIANNMQLIKKMFDSNEIYDMFPLTSTIITVGRTLCADNTVTQAVCVATLFAIVGSDPGQLNATTLPEILSNLPAGSSAQTFYHYLQLVITKKFQSYDYGPSGNYKQYGQMTPLEYDLKKVTAPLALIYGANDLLTPKTNILETYSHLPNGTLLEEVPLKLFNHIDFLWAIDAKNLLYDRVIELLQKFNNQTSK